MSGAHRAHGVALNRSRTQPGEALGEHRIIPLSMAGRISCQLISKSSGSLKKLLLKLLQL